MISDLRKISKIIKEHSFCLPDEELSNFIFILEDKRFLYHIGFDPIATVRATLTRLMGNPKGGASTLDMQLVRTITGRREKTAYRKFREITLAILVRGKFGRKMILSCYLQILYSGTGLVGIEAASRSIYGKSSFQCSTKEKSLLAAVILLPLPRRPTLNWGARITNRARYARRKYRFGWHHKILSDRFWRPC